MRTSTKRLPWLVLLPVAIGAVAAGYVSSSARATDPRNVTASGPMPEIDEPAITGGRVRSSELAGRPVLVNFWASWCGPCRREQPGLRRLAVRYDGRVSFLGVNWRDDPAAARVYLEEFSVPYPSVADPTGIIAHHFGVPYLPATILVDARGQMRYRLAGAQAETTLERYLEELLAEAEAPAVAR